MPRVKKRENMKCPNCKTEIDDKEISHYMASKGGKKSKRKITPDQQAEMQAARNRKKEAKCGH